MADRQSRGAVEQPVQLVHAAVIHREAQQRVLHHRVVHVVLPQLRAKSGVLGNRDALVVHQHAGGCVFQLVCQLRHDRLLLAENFCVRHSCFHLH